MHIFLVDFYDEPTSFTNRCDGERKFSRATDFLFPGICDAGRKEEGRQRKSIIASTRERFGYVEQAGEELTIERDEKKGNKVKLTRFKKVETNNTNCRNFKNLCDLFI